MIEVILLLLFVVVIVGWIIQDMNDRRCNRKAMQALAELRQLAKEGDDAARITLWCYFG